MGAEGFSHYFEALDWKEGVERLQKEAREHYGDNPYSGTIATVTGAISLHKPIRPLTTPDMVRKYVERRFDTIDRGGEVIDLGVCGYLVGTAKVEKYEGQLPITVNAFKKRSEPALLMHMSGYIVSQGTVEYLKDFAQRAVIREKFRNEYLVVSKTLKTAYKISGQLKQVKTTTRKSDEKTAVLPVKKFIVYGWGRS